jgi:hypothetical protein
MKLKLGSGKSLRRRGGIPELAIHSFFTKL